MSTPDPIPPDTPEPRTSPSRGARMTRIETFVDAAFAFAVTLLVVSIDSIPESVPQLVEAFKGVPAFAGSFVLIAVFWHAHHRWSEMFGLDDGPTIALSLLLVFQVLVYVYPLKMLFASLFHWLSGGALASGLLMETQGELATLFILYGLGFAGLGGTIWLLYAHAWGKREELDLTVDEAVHTRTTMLAFLFFVGAGLGSAGAAALHFLGVGGWGYLIVPGMVFNLLILIPFVTGPYGRRVRKRLEGSFGG
jgi:hypothetical protein